MLLRFWTSRIATVRSATNQQTKLGLVLEEKKTAHPVPKSDNRVEFGLGQAKTRNRRRSSFASGGVTDTGKLLMLLGDKGNGEAARGPGKSSFVLDEIERLLFVEREVKELSLPVYDPNRGRLHPRELYALIHVIFSDTNIQVYLHKKFF